MLRKFVDVLGMITSFQMILFKSVQEIFLTFSEKFDLQFYINAHFSDTSVLHVYIISIRKVFESNVCTLKTLLNSMLGSKRLFANSFGPRSALNTF